MRVEFGNIDDRFISEDAEDTSVIKDRGAHTVRFPPRLRLAIPVAACLCIIAFGAYVLFRPSVSDVAGRPVLQWSAQFSAEDYFKYNSSTGNDISSAGSLADYAMPYAETRSFSDNRAPYEAGEIIPAMPGYPMFNCYVNYNDDDSIYSVVFSWHIRDMRGGVGDYSDLSVTAGYQAIEMISDCMSIGVDDNGNIIEPAVTVTERGGVQIVAEGNENMKKTLTFQNESGWYQIEGSWNDSYASMVALLDWIWEHPIDFGLFSIDAGDHFTSTTLDQMPGAFSGYIPDFAAYGFIKESDYVSLKNGAPYAYEGQFIAHTPEELVKEGSYYDVEGWTIIHWCIFTDPEYYYIRESLGELNELTEQIVFGQFDSSRNQSRIAFTWDGLFIMIYSNTPQELWAIIEVFMGTKG